MTQKAGTYALHVGVLSSMDPWRHMVPQQLWECPASKLILPSSCLKLGNLKRRKHWLNHLHNPGHIIISNNQPDCPKDCSFLSLKHHFCFPTLNKAMYDPRCLSLFSITLRSLRIVRNHFNKWVQLNDFWLIGCWNSIFFNCGSPIPVTIYKRAKATQILVK